MSLPPLPEPNVEYVSGHRDPIVSYDKEQMQAYGQACYEKALLDAMNKTLPYSATGAVIATAIRSLK